MEMRHWLFLLVILVIGYTIGTHKPFGLPLIG
jgi:hypothetical protein